MKTISIATLKSMTRLAGLTIMALLMPVVASAAITLGDVDSDGKVAISDVTDLIDYLLTGNGHDFDLLNADADRDGIISISDVTTIIDYLLKGEDMPEPLVEVIQLTPTVSITMVKVTGGTFLMGADAGLDSDAAPWEGPIHSVTVADFAMGMTEVTQEQWLAVMGSNPSRFTGDLQRPVEGVSWNDCQQFITRLREMTGRPWRLPTEAEWEYAARGGQYAAVPYRYAGSDNVGQVARWGYNATAGTRAWGTHAVASLLSCELGLHDMSGNVWEWCQDWFGPYSDQAATNPKGPDSGTEHVLRGGCWSGPAKYCRVSERLHLAPAARGDITGLRLAL